MSYNAVSVLTTATLIVTNNCARRNLSLSNASDATIVYLGSDSSVTTSTGFPLYPNQTRDQDRIAEGYLGDIYGIVASDSANVRYWQVLK